MPVFRYVTPARLQAELDKIQQKNRIAKNGSAAPINGLMAVAWRADGTLMLASAMIPNEFAGITSGLISADQYGEFYKEGTVPGILNGLRAVAGQPVFLGVEPGTVTLTAPTDPGASIVKLGMAEPPDDSTTGAAIDLYLEPEVIAEV